MSEAVTVRWGWLKFMYLYTIVVAGGMGLGTILMPATIIAMFSWPDQDPIVLGIFGSVYLAFGILALFGLRAPLKFVPVLFLQLIYKSVWFIGVILPLFVAGHLPSHAVVFAGIFATYIIGDLIAIPFPYLFTKQLD